MVVKDPQARPPGGTRALAAACLLGALAMGAQVVLFREGLVRAGGDELALGSMLAAWLLAAAVGAWLSSRPRARRERELWAAGLLLVLTWILGAACWRHVPAIGGTLPGERQGSLLFLVQALLWNGPAGLLQGWLFARLARRRGAQAPSLLAWEALGSAAAGWLLSLGPVIALLPAGDAHDTRHGRFEVVERGGERWLQRNGKDSVLLAGAAPDPLRSAALRAALVHSPPRPRTVFAGDVALLPELLAHEPSAVDLLLPDSGPRDLLRAVAGPELAAALDDRRVRIHARTPRGFWSQIDADHHYDLVWLGGVDPDHAAQARETTVEAFERARAHIAPAGCLALRLGALDGVPGSTGMRIATLIAAGAADAGFAPLALPDGTLLALEPGREVDLEALGRLWPDTLDAGSSRALNLTLRGAEQVDPLEVLLSAGELDLARLPRFDREPRHTDRTPRAALAARLLLEEHARGGTPRLLARLHATGPWGFVLLAAIALALLARLAAGREGGATRGLEGFSLTGNGLVGSAGLILILERHQALTGALYADLGWLSGAFLLGFASGARGAGARAGRWAAAGGADVGTLVGLGIVFLWASSPAPSALGAAFAALFLGAAVGAPVASLARLRGAGWAWGLDLLGSAPGAWLAGAWLIPGLGWSTTLGALAALKAVALCARAVRGIWARLGARDHRD